jgi:hypothetical protein
MYLASQFGRKNGCILKIKLRSYKTDISPTTFPPQDVHCNVQSKQCGTELWFPIFENTLSHGFIPLQFFGVSCDNSFCHLSPKICKEQEHFQCPTYTTTLTQSCSKMTVILQGNFTHQHTYTTPAITAHTAYQSRDLKFLFRRIKP